MCAWACVCVCARGLVCVCACIRIMCSVNYSNRTVNEFIVLFTVQTIIVRKVRDCYQ